MCRRLQKQRQFNLMDNENKITLEAIASAIATTSGLSGSAKSAISASVVRLAKVVARETRYAAVDIINTPGFSVQQPAHVQNLPVPNAFRASDFDFVLAPVAEGEVETTIADVVRDVLLVRGWKQKQLAEELDLHESQLSEILRGKRPVTIAMASQLFKRFGVSADILLKLQPVNTPA